VDNLSTFPSIILSAIPKVAAEAKKPRGTQRDKNPQVKPPKNYSHSVVAKPNFLIPYVTQSLSLLIVIMFIKDPPI
jgi:hypothetical protein